MSLYQELSRVYDDLFPSKRGKVDWVVEKLNLKQNSRVLDLGCGTGDFVHWEYTISSEYLSTSI